MEDVFPQTKVQRCWVHKTANVLNKLPKSLQNKAKANLHNIWMAGSKEHAQKAFDLILGKYQAKYPKAIQCLEKGRQNLLTFYDFSAEHWKHIRTINLIESTFGTVKHRTQRSKGFLGQETAMIMVFKLIKNAEKSWRRLDGNNQLPKLISGVTKGGCEFIPQDNLIAA